MAKVFISCGQAVAQEKSAAQDLRKFFCNKKHFKHSEVYVAAEVQSLSGFLEILDELEVSDYYVFVDFHRTGSPPFSLFTHQELAVAQRSGFRPSEIAVLQQEGLQSEGLLKYMQSNPRTFKSYSEVVKVLEPLVKDWHPEYSRHLRAEIVDPKEWFLYSDYFRQAREKIWKARITNKRPDRAAERAVCILDWLKSPTVSNPSPDRTPLKWAGQRDAYETTILPEDCGEVDLFASRAREPGIYLHSRCDVEYLRGPVAREVGKYEFHYKVYARGFPLWRFSVRLEYEGEPDGVVRAEIIQPDLDSGPQPSGKRKAD